MRTRERHRLPAGIQNGEELLERQMTPRASGMREPQGFGPDRMARPFAGGTSPVKTEHPVYEEDHGKLAAWDKDGYLRISPEPMDGRIYGRQNGRWVVVAAPPEELARWDTMGLRWDQPGVRWDRANPTQMAALGERITELEAVVASLRRK